MRVAYISPPYKGHYSVLLPLWKENESAHLYVVRFKNDPQIEEAGHERITVITLLQNRTSEVAKDFNDVRSSKLENVLRCFLHNFNPEQVVYDFFCLEAKEACVSLGIPAICSIPAMLKEDETETCSDGLLPKEKLYWLWKHPYKVSINPVVFMGPRDRGDGIVQGFPAEEIWVCFGTVVPRYAGCQEQLQSFLKQLQTFAEKHKQKQFVLYNVCFDRQFDHLLNVRVVWKADLVQKLQSYPPKLLIFHGGGNTYTEAIHYRVPNLLVVPFFGDQFETAKRVGNVYSGDLEQDLKQLQPVDYSNIGKLGNPFQDTFEDYFRSGDLVFGQRKNRDALQANFPYIDLHLNHYAPFEEFANPDQGDVPAIADVYNDSYQNSKYAEDQTTEFGRRMLEYKNARLQNLKRVSHSEEHMLVYYCVELLYLTVKNWGGKIHFVLGEPAGIATNFELYGIHMDWKSLSEHVIFYNTKGKRIHAPYYMNNRKERNLKEIIIAEGSRDKSDISIKEKQNKRNLPIVDKHASRTGYITKHIPPDGKWHIHVATCDLRIHYYYNIENQEERQYWPWIYLHNYTEGLKEGSIQRKAQDILEQKKIKSFSSFYYFLPLSPLIGIVPVLAVLNLSNKLLLLPSFPSISKHESGNNIGFVYR